MTNPHTPEFGLLAEDRSAALALTRSLFGSAPARRVTLAALDPDGIELEAREEAVHLLNAKLRKRGWKPRPLGDSDARDRAKASAYATASWLHRMGRPKRGARDYS